MIKKPKKQISISVPLDIIEKIERINQDAYSGHMKVKNVMLTLIDLGLLAVDGYGDIRIAWGILEREAKELEQEQEPAIIPSHGIVLEFPFGKRLSAGSQDEGARP